MSNRTGDRPTGPHKSRESRRDNIIRSVCHSSVSDSVNMVIQVIVIVK